MKNKILVVDDDIAICELLTDVLSEHVFEVRSCHLAQSALQTLQQEPDIALVLSLDGQINFTPNYGDTLTITKHKGSVCILYPKEYGFFNTLTAKLKWGSR